MTVRRIVLRNRSRPCVSLDETLVPLINIVFLLLVFFLVSGDLSGVLSDDLTPPASSIQQPPSTDDEWLGLKADGSLLWRGRTISRVAFIKELDAHNVALPASLQLRVDSNANSRSLLPLLTQLQARGVADVHVLTLSRQAL